MSACETVIKPGLLFEFPKSDLGMMKYFDILSIIMLNLFPRFS